MTDVLCIGHAAYDVVLPLPHYPLENQNMHWTQKWKAAAALQPTLPVCWIICP